MIKRNDRRRLSNLLRPSIFALLATMLMPGIGFCQQPVNGLPDNGWEVPVETGVQPPVDQPPAAVAAGNPAPGQQIVASKRLIQVIRSGGPLMIPIGICSLILMVFVFERMISLRRGRIIPTAFSTRFLDQLREGELNREAAMTLCNRNNSPLAQVFRAGVAKWGRTSVEVEQAVLDEGERNSNQLRRYLRLINGIATVCPLLGLLGTVLGMIQAFDAIASVNPAVADPKLLIATGISQALLTTAAGMTVAIPALIAYLFFSSRVDRHVMDIDALGQKVVSLISAEALAENSRGPEAKRAA
jgi:biopolymer transport protein ExbB